MRCVASLLLPLLLASGLACDGLVTPGATPDAPPDLEATVRAVLSDVQSAPAAPGAEGDPDATITARVQATVQALMAATPIPSPTPTGAPAPRVAPPTRVSGPQLLPTATPTPLLRPTAVPTTIPKPTVTSTDSPPPTCGPAPDGTQVTASVDGAQIAVAQVAAGEYTLFVDSGDGSVFAGKNITFKIGDWTAEQTAVLVVGGVSELDLTASLASTPDPTPAARSVMSMTAYNGLLAQMVPPHVFVGTASIDC